MSVMSQPPGSGPKQRWRWILLAAGVLAMAWVVSLNQRSTGLPVAVLEQLFAQDPSHGAAAGGRQQPGTPSPPRPQTWTTPLQRRCGGGEAGLLQRLQARARQINNASTRLRIHPTNFGERFRHDAFGNPLDATPRLVVLHETVYGIGSAINTFITPHPNDDDQVSYHALIGLDGAVIQVLDPLRRAFGSGNSAFNGEWAVTNPSVSGSVNNFALHVSLETPLDGEDDESAHSGYSSEQYDALAVLLSTWMRRFGIPFDRITTHAHVDLGGERSDPRSFDWSALELRLAALGLLCS